MYISLHLLGNLYLLSIFSSILLGLVAGKIIDGEVMLSTLISITLLSLIPVVNLFFICLGVMSLVSYLPLSKYFDMKIF